MNNKPLSCSIAISNNCSNANAQWLDDVVMSVLAGFFPVQLHLTELKPIRLPEYPGCPIKRCDRESSCSIVSRCQRLMA